MSLHEHFPLPFRTRKVVTSEYIPTTRDYTEEEAKALADQALQRYLSYLEEHQTTVLSAEVSTTVGKDKVDTEGKLILLSAAWEQVAVQEEEWRQQSSNEYSGNDDGTAGGT